MAIRARDTFYSPVDILEDQPRYGSERYTAASKKISIDLSLSSLIVYIKENRARLAPLIILAGVNAIILLLVLIYHTPILTLLENLGLYLKQAGAL